MSCRADGSGMNSLIHPLSIFTIEKLCHEHGGQHQETSSNPILGGQSRYVYIPVNCLGCNFKGDILSMFCVHAISNSEKLHLEGRSYIGLSDRLQRNSDTAPWCSQFVTPMVGDLDLLSLLTATVGLGHCNHG